MTKLRAVSRPGPLRVEIASAIKELIVRGGYKFNQHLIESELAAQLGVSRLPVREALQDLSRDGWVDLKVGYGAFVHTPSAREIDEVFSVRTALESEAAYQAAKRVKNQLANEEELEDLKAILQVGSAEANHGVDTEIVDHNAQLHSAIINLSGNHVLSEMTAAIEARVRWYFSAIAVKRAPASWEEHGGVVEAILHGDSDRARSLMSAHCERSRKGLLDLPSATENTD